MGGTTAFQWSNEEVVSSFALIEREYLRYRHDSSLGKRSLNHQQPLAS
jgi:hypothetical protein